MERLTRYKSHSLINRVFEEARSLSEEKLARLGMTTSNVEQVQKILSALLYPSATLRAEFATLEKNNKGQSGLWSYGVSGDLPVLLLHVSDADDPLLSETLQAYLFWRSLKAKINLVILNDQDTGYGMELHNQIMSQLVHMGADVWLNQREGIFLLRTDQIPEADRILLETFASVILDPQKGSLAEHAQRLSTTDIRLPAFIPALPGEQEKDETADIDRPADLQMDNGLGGFSPDGKEYVIYLGRGQTTPKPWINVVANPRVGFLVSESGSGYTWAENSGENRLSPWRNDPVADTPGEAIYLRDEETGAVWSPTPLPAGKDAAFVVRHGAGYTTFESRGHGLNQFLRLFAAVDAPVKIASLHLKNMWDKPRRITVTYYCEWVLGVDRQGSKAFILSDYNPSLNALMATNHYNPEFWNSVAFLSSSKTPHGVTSDRDEFLGRTGDYHFPAALGRIGLASTVRAGLDPCAAIQLHVDLRPGEEEEVFFLVGEGRDLLESQALIEEFQQPGKVAMEWEAVQRQWDDLLGQITVQTPEPGMDLMLNRWLLYQAVSCRIWGRSALYQSSGAFGFRDQLQDVLAVLQTRPQIAREHILNAAGRQFEAGDVLHWWHPPSGRGIRTRFSDDLLWLPYVVAEYVTTSGDRGILSEKIPFLKGDVLRPEENERYGQYESASEGYTLFEHCRRAIEKGITSGPHGLPLMGTGDWNDGMNLVGANGRGESVWLGWFTYATLMRFVILCEAMREDPSPYRRKAEALAKAIESTAWDGDWYLRAYYDDGAKLGSRTDNECIIDSISQSWAVLSEAGNPHRAAYAMASVEQRLIKESDQLVLLLTPPFHKTRRNPGYIKAYPPGIRENGGQYTHAAIWVGWAFARLGEGNRAEAVFRLLNPIYHADSDEKMKHYQVEPYVIAADVYSQFPHTGNGGWTWYTGSAAWMYRLGIEAILGITREGKTLIIDPCIPSQWPGFSFSYRFGNTIYRVQVKNPQGYNRGVSEAWMDDVAFRGNRFPLVDDGVEHLLTLVIGPRVSQVKKKKKS